MVLKGVFRNLHTLFYTVGSFILAKTCDSGEVFCKLSGEEVEGVKEQLSGYFTEIIINGERYDALALD